MTAQRAWADYVTDIVVIGHDSERQVGYLYDNYKGAGWIGIDRDLNDGAGGHYIHLVYKTNKSPQNSGTPITDLYLWSAPYAGPNSLVHNGRTYYRVGADGDDTFKSHAGDMNCEAGGNWIQLYYTKDILPHHRYLTGISVDENASGCVGENGGSTPGDLNRGAGGDDIFLHFSIDYESWDAHRAGSFSHVDGNTIYIENEAELALLSHDVNERNDYYEKTIILNRDLDLSEYAWEPIGNEYFWDDHLGYLDNSKIVRISFRGNFDGRGHTIRGLFVDKDVKDRTAGLFGCIKGYGWDPKNLRGCEWIKNLNIIGAYVKGRESVGILTGYVFGRLSIDNVVVQGYVSGTNRVGGIVGYGDKDIDVVNYSVYTVAINNCVNLGYHVSGSNSGAIYGYIEDGSRVVNNANYYANLSSPGNGKLHRLSTVRYDNPPEGIKLDFKYSNCYWLDGIPYCKGNSTVEYTASSNTFYYDLTGTSLNGENKGLRHSFQVAEGTDYNVKAICDATGIAGDGSETSPYILSADKQWSQLLNMYRQGRRFNGLHFKLGADITLSELMPGFGGTFDGGGHTMNINLTANDTYCAPFSIARNATFKNLRVAGTIATDKTHSAGLVGRAYGTTGITNCRSSVSILSSTPGHGGHGGFVGSINNEDSNISIDGCLFDGKILTEGNEATINCGGFVGESSNRPTLTIANCLYAPVQLADGEKEATEFSSTLVRYTDNVIPDIVNTGYTRPLGSVQGVSGIGTKPDDMGDAIGTYSVSGITSYAEGIEYNGWWYKNMHALELADNAPNSSLISEAAGTYGTQPLNVTLKGRTFYGDNNWNTVCLPFDVTLAGSPLDGAEARTLSKATLTDGTLTLNFCEPVEKLTAGTPYIIKMDPKAVQDIYTIQTAADWDAFAEAVENGLDCTLRTVNLVSDITVSTPVGSTNHPFTGTFDGNGHTLTFNSTSNGKMAWAPFSDARNATIKNLHVAGTLTITNSFCSALAGSAYGVNIINCRVSADIVCTGGQYFGGFVGFGGQNCVFKNCLFDGSFTNKTSSTARFGAFLFGLLGDVSQYTNCLSKPKSITGDNILLSAFGSAVETRATHTNCYYSEEFPLDHKDGTPIGNMTDEELAAALGDGWQVKDGEVLPVMEENNYGSRIVNPIFYGAAITAKEPINITPGLAPGTEGDGSVTFMGTYDPVEIGPEGDNTKLYFSTGNTLYWPNGAMTINPFRAYLQLNGATAQTRSIVLNIGGETTAIEVGGVKEVKEVKDDSWYDMSGRRLDGKPTAKGFYINNGKKVVIK